MIQSKPGRECAPGYDGSMRIISGTAKGRRLHAPSDAKTTRPLPDRVRTAVFNMLTGHIEGEAFLDVFAGTGSFGLEALSRGAASCLFVERDKEIVDLLRRNIEELGLEDRADVHHGDALGAAALSRAPRPLHVVLFDPPYSMMKDEAKRLRVFEQFASAIELLDETGFAIIRTPWPFVEHVGEPDNRRKLELSLDVDGAIGPETHAYGSTAVHWYMRDPEAAAV
jgi:16S rRNA (guanine(966)-N(2))-methyltransferase RsmD